MLHDVCFPCRLRKVRFHTISLVSEINSVVWLGKIELRTHLSVLAYMICLAWLLSTDIPL